MDETARGLSALWRERLVVAAGRAACRGEVCGNEAQPQARHRDGRPAPGADQVAGMAAFAADFEGCA
jgi:hypothetical protein